MTSRPSIPPQAPRNPLRGSALLATVALTAVVVIIAMAVLRGAVVQRRLSDRYQLYADELAMAELQVTKALGQISYALQKGGATDPEAVVNLVGPASVDGYEVTSFSVALLSDVTAPVPPGEQFEGYTLRQLRYRVASQVRRTDERAAGYEHPGVAVQQELTVYYVPLSIFGIFSDPVLELHPGADFVENGWVHSNRNFYYGSDGKKFEVRNRVTVAGELVYGRHPSAPQHDDGGKTKGLDPNGQDRFWDGEKLVLAKDAQGKRIDSHYQNGAEDFASKAMDLWNGFVRDRSLGVGRLEMPWPSRVGEEEISASEYIQPQHPDDIGALREHKFAYKAGLFITRENGQVIATRPDGSQVPLTYKVGNETRSVVSSGGFYNEREGENVQTLDIDLGRMREAGIAPANGMVFIENRDARGAVRVVNAANLPGDPNVGFSIATPNALYVKGDYNTVNETVSMLAADAIYILSEDWKDSDNTQAKRSNGAPEAKKSVTTNAVIGAGNVPTQVDGSGRKQYSGGVENFFRYMENWSGKTHTFKGSILQMFHSRRTTGFWSKQKYNPPNRNWSWNSELATRVPPGAPVTFKTRRSNWSLAQVVAP